MDVDYTLITKARSGDEGAYAFIVARHMGLIRRKARSFFLCGGTQDDLVQEGLIGLWKAVRDFRPDAGASFRTFTDLCVTRQMISAVKQASRKKHQPLNSSVPLESNPFTEGEAEGLLRDILADAEADEPSNQVAAREMAGSLIEGLLKELSNLESEVLYLYLQEKSYEEIAAELDRDAKSVDNAIQRIRRKFGFITGQQ
jgi:RNA polymerase sporulation-specific sigma factor